MGILRFLYTLILTVLLTGCYEEINLDIETQPVLCINSLCTAGEPIDISLTHSWLYDDKDGETNHNVADGKISIFANGKQVGTDYILKEGDMIKIMAESNLYGKAEAEVSVPQGVPISAVTWDGDIVSCEKWDNYGDVVHMIKLNIKAKMTLNDPNDIDNYYLFSFSYNSEKEEKDFEERGDVQIASYSLLNFVSNAEPIFSEHIDQLDAVAGNESYQYTFFTDRQFSGKSYTLNLQFDDIIIYIKNIESPTDLEDFGLNLMLNSISQSYYNWCIYQWTTEFGIISDLGEIGMTDQIWGCSNVSTGAGVVAAKASDSYFINLKDIVYKELSSQQ